MTEWVLCLALIAMRSYEYIKAIDVVDVITRRQGAVIPRGPWSRDPDKKLFIKRILKPVMCVHSILVPTNQSSAEL